MYRSYASLILDIWPELVLGRDRAATAETSMAVPGQLELAPMARDASRFPPCRRDETGRVARGTARHAGSP